MKNIKVVRPLLFAAVLAAGILIGWFAKPGVSHPEQATTDAKSGDAATIWTCSMDPQVRQPEPGKCPLCGMDLIPLTDNADAGGDPLEIRMSPTALQLANVQTAAVGYGLPAREIRLNGKVQADERRIYSQVSHLEGRVEQLSVNFTGEALRPGQTLGMVYSPTLVTAQEELFAAQKMKDLQPALFAAAREKLKNWKLTDAQIDEILAAGKARERFPLTADVGGVVLEKKVNLGDYLMRGMPLYTVADLSRVWVQLEVYEADLAWVRVGSAATFSVQSLPGQTFSGVIRFIDPAIHPETRVALARVEMVNPGGRLKPGMFVAGTVKTRLSTRTESLVAPKSAVLWTGERSVVYVKTSSEQNIGFSLREVTLGPVAGEGYVVLSGLKAGEEIAVSGAFSIDAAAQLAGKPSMMNPKGSSASGGHQQGAMAGAEITPAAQQALRAVFDRYFPLKDALVRSDFAAAKKEAGLLKIALEQTDMRLFSGKAHELWMRHSAAAATALRRLLQAPDVEAARAAFKPLSAQMVALATAFKPFDSPVFVQHCPMADDNSGADWLSLDREIRNPYFGDKMLKCGSVTNTIQ
ncbi:MAG: efflux RND transporter periplasmic adaptor subunit [Saprospiraceae bacterium]|nr:efflux RND transporter periplasmic adaptor subunit [Saprospiraceae bacterium]